MAKKKRVAFKGNPLIEDYTETTNVINLNVSVWHVTMYLINFNDTQ
jgi:hypothetical protein